MSPREFFSKAGILNLPTFTEKHVEFVEAETMEEGKEFAMKHFGIELDFGDDEQHIDIMNWALRGITDVYNLFEGTAHMPKKLGFDDDYFREIRSAALAVCTTSGHNLEPRKDRIAINRALFDTCYHSLIQCNKFDYWNELFENMDNNHLKYLDKDILKRMKAILAIGKENITRPKAVEFTSLQHDLYCPFTSEVGDKMMKNEEWRAFLLDAVERQDPSINFNGAIVKEVFFARDFYSQSHLEETIRRVLNFVAKKDVENTLKADFLPSSPQPQILSECHIIYHEMGHLLHFHN